MSAWKPIETAPKIATLDTPLHVVLVWSPVVGIKIAHIGQMGDSLVGRIEGGYHGWVEVTHWMPLSEWPKL